MSLDEKGREERIKGRYSQNCEIQNEQQRGGRKASQILSFYYLLLLSLEEVSK